MLSSFEESVSNLNRLKQRKALFEDSLLPQMDQQVKATLTAYTHDDGDFAAVIRAKIDELNAQIEALEITVNMTKTKAKLNYLLVGENVENKVTKPNSEHNYE